MRRHALSLTSALLSAAFVAPAMAAVPFFNASCPGDIDVHADDGGSVYVQGREATLKRFNDRYFEARDANSGITLSISRSDDGTPQISYTGRGGANGICQVSASGTSAPAANGAHPREVATGDAALPREVTCESTDEQQVSCDLNTRGNVEIVRQLSHTRCEEGKNWGLSRHSVWVNGGCRAVFRNVSSVTTPAPAGDTALGACNMRKGAQGALVTQMPVGSDYQELIIDYPDGRFLCMMRNSGQVQSLTPVRRRGG
ncbi:DUF3011 domain-containing protein [Stenotrophomonas sp. BSUC-16]|jgi:hypothetical protein|uniref:DUF3011 domain-containing protein n=1 Tax=Stenotrophomonas TaxID=40323 RepID=UPI000DA71855|nr:MULTISPECIES: DUF3011 domain-containing protein [Stenotrophomonas maltophilia group]MCO5738933.1 DUF3011 domain-containing protein [Stenotrophomonas maltophilia]MCZ7844606.1 DUF3011 domain-containing protein [Stenotrophomonas maltophilia]MDJ1626618.1 DUF3011 domain-containing protein [Stenotrophomonas sepilia]PZT40660.1 hypothetical protein A7X97_04605 [Stenotrophomonas sepilia]UXB36440.1 DUF3011 domain-containing protein [Stenotrophomonas maltophilia]